MTRRELFVVTGSAGALYATSQILLTIPVHHVVDNRAKYTSEELQYFSSRIWVEAARDFQRCGIHLERVLRAGEIRRSPSGDPIFTGLDQSAVNLVLTDHIPLNWDNGRGAAGVAARYQGYDLCVISIKSAHCHQVPFISVNTCVHEMLHVLLRDISQNRPNGLEGDFREARIDWLATRLWLFRDGAAIRRAANAYVDRLHSRLAHQE
jgi:hypothetical protein